MAQPTVADLLLLVGEWRERLAAWEAENARLRAEVTALRAEVAVLSGGSSPDRSIALEDAGTPSHHNLLACDRPSC